MAQEPVYDVIGAIGDLKRLTITIAVINGVLTLYFVPFAGTAGAAAATMMSMFIYFVLFGKGQDGTFILNKRIYIVAGLAIYLVYMILHHMAWGVAVTICLAPPALGAFFYLIGLFGSNGSTQAAPD